MTHDDLVEKLQAMLATATPGDDVTATVLLFGILFDDEIRDSGSNGNRIGKSTGKDYGPMVTDGQKLARLGFVQPSAEMVQQWKTGMTDDSNLQYAIERLTLAIEWLKNGRHPEHVLGELVNVKERLTRVRRSSRPNG